MTADPDVPVAAAAAAERLVERYRDALPPELIQQILTEAYRTLRSEARISAYVSVLAERAAEHRLDELARRDGSGTAPLPSS
jgi:hypothetical protein